MVNFTHDINWRPDHYFAKYWNENADPYVGQLPGTNPGFPLKWVLTVMCIVYFIRVWGPSWMEKREAFDVKPWVLPLNGFAFGGYITAILTVVVPTNFFMDCFDCKAYSPSSDKYTHITIKHFAYGTIYAKLFDFLIPIFFVLAKKPGVTNLHLLYLMCVSLGSVALVKINPGGIFIFAALTDGLFCIILYSYLTFAAASDNFRPSQTWKWVVFHVKMITWTLILAHSAYFMSVPNCGDPAVKLGLVIFSCLVLVLFPYDWITTHRASTERRATLLSAGNKLTSIQQQVFQTTDFSAGIEGKTQTTTPKTNETRIQKTVNESFFQRNRHSF